MSADTIRIVDLGRMAYAAAFDVQRETHECVFAGDAETILLVEHDPVITISQRRDCRQNLLLDECQLAARGIDVQPTDRGGDITYHGPGQLVVYPIIRLADHGLNLGRYMRLLESATIATLARFGITGYREEGATGVWVDTPATSGSLATRAKICAMGVRVRRNITMHGLALNVATNLEHFNVIVPCGLADRAVTSLDAILMQRSPTMETVKTVATESLLAELHAASPKNPVPSAL